MRYFIHMSYNGNRFHGWQMQPNTPTVQATLENAISLLLKEPIGIMGCGRTDTGVHALNFYAHFDTEKQFSKPQLIALIYKLNSFLNQDIRIYDIFEVPLTLHARFDAISRQYQYHISSVKQPFLHEFTHRIFYTPDIELMNKAAKILFLYTDFTSFSKLHTQTVTNNCTIYQAHWDRVGEELIFTIKANRFLRNMVRAITGTLLDVGRKKVSIEEFQHIIESKNRCNASLSMPAKALFLTEIKYPFHNQ